MKTTNYGSMLLLRDAPGLITPLSGQTYANTLIETINQTKLSLDVIQYQWNFYPGKPESTMQKINRAVLARIDSGVKTRILLNKEGRGAHLTAINMKASRFLSDAGAVVKFSRTFPITHAKLWLFDDNFTILGSHNLSNRSVTVNNEVSVLIKSRPVNVELRRYFGLLFGNL